MDEEYIDKSAFNQFRKEILDSIKILNGYIKYLHSPFYLFNYFTIQPIKMRMHIPFHRPYITESEIDAVKDTLKSGWLTMGPKTIEFEEGFRRYIGCKNTVAVNSCTAALHLALKAIDLRQGDEVITSPFTFAAAGEVICYFKARPVFVDIEMDTCNINVNKIEERLLKKQGQ